MYEPINVGLSVKI